MFWGSRLNTVSSPPPPAPSWPRPSLFCVRLSLGGKDFRSAPNPSEHRAPPPDQRSAVSSLQIQGLAVLVQSSASCPPRPSSLSNPRPAPSPRPVARAANRRKPQGRAVRPVRVAEGAGVATCARAFAELPGRPLPWTFLTNSRLPPLESRAWWGGVPCVLTAVRQGAREPSFRRHFGRRADGAVAVGPGSGAGRRLRARDCGALARVWRPCSGRHAEFRSVSLIGRLWEIGF